MSFSCLVDIKQFMYSVKKYSTKKNSVKKNSVKKNFSTIMSDYCSRFSLGP